jgi:hypothetical protein
MPDGVDDGGLSRTHVSQLKNDSTALELTNAEGSNARPFLT